MAKAMPLRKVGPGRARGVARVVVAAALAGAGGCGEGNVYHEPPPPDVIVVKPERRAVTSYLEHTGTAQASEKVELRARVKGFLRQRLFRDGDDVKAGQVLFVIDEEPFRVRLAQTKARLGEAEAATRKAEQSKARQVAQAQLDVDQAQLTLSKIEEARTRSLVARNAGSQEDLDRNEATRKKAQAQVGSDRANIEQIAADYESNILSAKSSRDAAASDVDNAALDLGYCRIASPIDGRVNAREFDVGNYVGDGQATLLATVLKTDPIYAYITPSENDLLRVQAMARQQNRKDYRQAEIPMELGLANEQGYPHQGVLDYTDPSVDTGTGTVRARGVFPNADGTITPGLFVRTRLPFERIESALLVPNRALGSDQGGAYLLVVGKDDKVERRKVVSGTAVGTLRVVGGEIGPDDRVVVDGLLRARPGMKVTPKLDAAAPAVASAARAQPSP